jgi:pimeloyl-ACP methyl ester carboxylesterase
MIRRRSAKFPELNIAAARGGIMTSDVPQRFESDERQPPAGSSAGRRSVLKALGLASVASGLAAPALAQSAVARSTPKPRGRNIVLVPGAFHGAWYFSPIVEQLRSAGHAVFTISLSGLAGPIHRPHAAINLDTHIEDVVSLIEQEKLDDVVLCGHSYGGMVIAGASERLGARIGTLLFIDAIVPADGESIWTILQDFHPERFLAASPDGLVTTPPPGTDPRVRPHPLGTFLQPIKLTGAAYAPRTKIYAWCHAQKGTPFERYYNQKSTDNDWSVHVLPSGHDFMTDAPEQARDLILAAAAMNA